MDTYIDRVSATIHPSDVNVVLYHGGCPDGIGAAYAFFRSNPKITFIGVTHNEPPPKLKRLQIIIIADFSYDRSILTELSRKHKKIVILDHHSTAKKIFEGWENPPENIDYIFDMSRSGAQIAWDYCYPDETRPWFIDGIGDRDLWKFELPFTKEICAALFHMGYYTLRGLEELEKRTKESEFTTNEFIEKGKLILEVQNKFVNYAVENSSLCEFQGYKVRLTTCHPSLRSEVGNLLALKDDCDFAAVWRYNFEVGQWWVCLRGSHKNQISVSDIAEKLGGGGHPKAAGFYIQDPRFDTDAPTRGYLSDFFKLVR